MVQDKGHHRASAPQQRAAAFTKLQTLRNTLSPEQKKERRKEMRELLRESLNYRYAVGTVEMGMFFSVRGQGDTWEQAFEAADKTAVARAA